MPSQELAWETPGVCPSCGVVADHIWFSEVVSFAEDHVGRQITHPMEGSQGKLLVSTCMSEPCQALTVWIERHDAARSEAELVYPQAGVRIPPEAGLENDEIKLYEEAAAVERMSPRAACALLRVLLEAFLKRHLADAGHSVRRKKLVEVIDLAVERLDLSRTLKRGLAAVREQGNTALHDPYGITENAIPEDLRWLFQAVDELVEELHLRPQKWADLAGIEDDEPVPEAP